MFDKFISPLIAKQFPSFYRQEGENFIAFVQAYYEWMEQTGNSSGVIGQSRSLIDYSDIDTTSSQFITHFTNQYIFSLPQDIIANKQLLVKHILDLYRSKGTPRAYALLFRLVFGEDISVKIPSNYIFKPSDNNWIIPKYIETTYNPYLNLLVGNQIQNINGSATAIVESVSQKVVSGKTINVIYLSSIKGKFRFGDQIISPQVPQITIPSSPRVIGSLTAIAIDNGGYGFNVGDILNVSGVGVNGKARVASTINQNGKVNFQLVSGGYGFTQGSTVTVATTINLGLNSSTANVFSVDDTLTDVNTGTTATVKFANTTFAQLINYSSTKFTVGDTVQNQSANVSATITSVLGGAGAGASFAVGDIVNKQVYQINNDVINNSNNIYLDDPTYGFNISISTTANSFTTGNTVNSSSNTIMLEGYYLSTNNISNFESLSNSAVGVSGLYVYKTDGAQVFVTGSQSNLVTAAANLSPGTVLISNTSGSQFYVTDHSPINTINAIANVVSSNTTSIRVNGSGISNMGYFVPSGIIYDKSTGHLATITNVTRLTPWSTFPGKAVANANLDTTISNVLVIYNEIVGTISYITNINPGSGYSTIPYVDVLQSDIAGLGITDPNGNLIGHDAVIQASVLDANGIVTAVNVIDSGFGYEPGGFVNLQSGNSTVVVTGTTVVDSDATGTSYWNSNKSFISDEMKLQDSNLYQKFSYQILAQRMLSSYENLVKNLVHPSGIALFGLFNYNDIQQNNTGNAVQITLNSNPI